MEYYTTAAQEKALDEKYLSLIKEKELDLKQEMLRTKKIQKFTAYALVNMPLRVFHIHDGNAYLNTIEPKNICPQEPMRDGGIYKLDGDYKTRIDTFLQKHPNYSVVFSPSGKYGPTADYCGKQYEMPAYLEANGERLVVDDDGKYCIGVA